MVLQFPLFVCVFVCGFFGHEYGPRFILRIGLVLLILSHLHVFSLGFHRMDHMSYPYQTFSTVDRSLDTSMQTSSNIFTFLMRPTFHAPPTPRHTYKERHKLENKTKHKSKPNPTSKGTVKYSEQ